MASRIKGITIEINGDSTGLQKALQGVQSKINSTNTALRDINKLLKFDPTNAELLKQKTSNLQQTIAGVKEKLNQLKEAEAEAKKQFEAGNLGADKYEALQREIISTEQYLQKLENTVGSGSQKLAQFSAKANEMGDKLSNAGKKLMPLSAAFAAAGIAAAKSSISFEDAFAGVEKTVDGTDEQLAKIKQGILDLSKTTASSATEIAEVAEAAGQLGIATDDVLSFTETMVMLGDSTNLSATEAASALAKFANITKTAPQDYSKLGSVIVDLGNNFATTESDIVAMSTKLASSGTLAGLTEPQIMALATAMSSVGIEAEAGGSAMSKLIKKIQVSVETGDSSLQKFASVANMSVDEFKKAFGQDAVGAMGSFISGLNDTERNGKSAIAVLDDMGLTEVRLSNTILSLASSGDLLTNSITTANGAWEDNTALQNEARKRYETTASKLKQLKATLVELGISLGDELLPYVQSAVDWLKKATENFKNMSPAMKSLTIKIIAFGASLAPLLSGAGKISTGIGAMAGAFSKAQTPVTKLWGALKANPYALVGAAALGFVVTLGKVIAGINEETKAAQKASQARQEAIASVESHYSVAETYAQKLENVMALENKSAGQKELIKTYVDKLNESVDGLNLSYDAESDKLNQSTSAIYKKIEAMKEEAIAAAYVEQAKKAYEDYAKTQSKVATKQAELAELEIKIAKIREKGASATTAELNELAKLESQAGNLTVELNDLTTASDKYAKEGDKLMNMSQLQGQAFQNLLTSAKTTMEQLPQTLVTGLQKGTYQIPTTVDQLNSLISFDKAVQKAGLDGSQAVSVLSSQMNAGQINVQTAVQRLNDVVKFNQAVSKAGLSGSKTASKFAEKIASGEMTVEEASKKLKDGAIEKLDGEEEAKIEGKNLAKGFKSGIWSLIGEVGDTAAKLVREAIKRAKKEQDSHSPSRVWRDQIGKMAGAGMAEGLESSTSLVEKAGAKLTQSALAGATLPTMDGGTITTRTTRELDYQQVYTAFNNALSEMNFAIVLNNRELGRGLKGMGVEFK